MLQRRVRRNDRCGAKPLGSGARLGGSGIEGAHTVHPEPIGGMGQREALLLLTWTTEGQSLRVVVPPGTAVRGGETIPLRPNLAHVVWMHAATGGALESC